MSRENLECLRQAGDAFNRRDRAAWLALCDPALENISPRDWPESGPVRGREAVWDFFVANMAPFDESPLRYGEIIEAGNDSVAAEVRGEVRGSASGASVMWSFWQAVTFSSGKALRIEWFADRAEALEAAAPEA